jgi:AraC family transcriptional regulator
MAMSDAYGQGLGKRFQVENAPAIITRVLRKADIAVTEVRCDDPSPAMSGSFPHEDAFLVDLHLRDCPTHEYWEDGRQAPVYSVRAGEVCLHDLKRNPVALLNKPYHCLFFYLPRVALNAICDDANAAQIGDLNYEPGAGVTDATISSLAGTIRPALYRPEQTNRLFVDHVVLAVGAHVAQTYGGMRPVGRPPRGGLAPWQAKRAQEILSANLEGVPLKDVARECGLSVSHFSRAFRQTMGVAPYNWLLARRIEVAKEKLRDGRLALSDVALQCGFFDQSHLTRVFTRAVGVSPGALRRALDD